MATELTIESGSKSRKQTAAELNNMALIMPANRTISSSGTVVNDGGIPTPDAAPGLAEAAGGSLELLGVYTYAVSFYDSANDSGVLLATTEGATSATASVTLTGGNQSVTVDLTTITNEAANSRVDKIRIYRTLNGGTVLFLVATVDSTDPNYTDTSSDATIQTANTARVGTQAWVPPGDYGFAVRHGARIFLGGAPDFYDYTEVKSGQMAWSELGSSDQFPTRNRVNVGVGDNGGPVRSASPQGDALVVYKERGIFLWLYQDNPDGLIGDGSIDRVSEDRGSLTFKTVVNVNGSHFVMDRKGWYLYRGGQTTVDMTEPLEPLLDRINWSQRAQFSGAADDKRVYWFVALDEDTECKHAVVLDLKAFQAGRGVRWWVYHYPHGVRDCAEYLEHDIPKTRDKYIAGTKHVVILSTFGWKFVLGHGYRDGYLPLLTARGQIVADASKTFTRFDSGDLYGASQYNSATAAGCFVRFKGGRVTEPQLIVSATVSTFTIETGLGFNLPSTTSFVIAGIDSYYKTGWLDMGDKEPRKQGVGMLVNYEPRGENFSLQASFARDRGSEDIYARTRDETGWNVTSTNGHVGIDMGGGYTSQGRAGFVEVPVGGKDFDHLQIKFHSNEVDSPWAVNSFVVKPRMRKHDR